MADTFDALTTTRPYQRAHEPKEALRIIHSLSGKRLDPTAVAALTAIYERGEIQVPTPMPIAQSVAAAAAGSSGSTTGRMASADSESHHTVAEMHTSRF